MENTYNDFCKSKGCSKYIEWEYSDLGCSAQCVSCLLMGESYNLEKYPENCLFLDDIKLINLTKHNDKE